MMITKEECFKQLRSVIDATLSTVDEKGNPQSRIIDIMHIEDEKIFFLTARGKHVYKEILNHPQVSYLCLNNNKSIRISGEAKKLDDQKYWIDLMFDENKFLNNVYPGAARYILEPFCIESGEMEYFDLTQKPIFRKSFTLNGGKITPKGFEITDDCVGCATCFGACPQHAINEGAPFEIMKEHCLHCGRCFENCPMSAIIKL